MCLGKPCDCVRHFHMCRDLDYCEGIRMIGKAISETIDRESWISLHRSVSNPAEFVAIKAFAGPLLNVRCVPSINNEENALHSCEYMWHHAQEIEVYWLGLEQRLLARKM